jgi:hypothetical protein
MVCYKTCPVGSSKDRVVFEYGQVLKLFVKPSDSNINKLVYLEKDREYGFLMGLGPLERK